MNGIRIGWLCWLTASVGCSGTQAAPPGGACSSADAIVAASDYSSSALIALALDGGQSLVSGIDLGRDPALTESRGQLFWVARDSGFIFALDACGRAKTRLDANDPAHPGSSNPQDVAVAADGALWIARFAVPSLLVLNGDGSTRATVDLSAYDVDGNPNMNAAVIVDAPDGKSKAYVSLERLDDNNHLASTRPSILLRIDAATAAVEAQLQLQGRNPFGIMDEVSGAGSALYLAEPGNFNVSDEPDAGIERVDVTSFTSTLLVAKHDLGASPVEVAVTQGCGAAIIADATPAVNVTSLVTFDPDTGTLFAPSSTPVLKTPEGFKLEGLVWQEGLLLVGDRSPSAVGYTVHVFDRTGACTLTERSPDQPIHVPQMPVGIRTAAR